MRKIFTLLVGCFLALSTSVAEAQDLWLDFDSGTATTGSYVDPAKSDAGAFTANGLKYSNGVELYLVKSSKGLLSGNNAKGQKKTIKLSNGAYNLILLPEEFETEKIEVIGYCNGKAETDVSTFTVYAEDENGQLVQIFADADQKLTIKYKDTTKDTPLEQLDKITCTLPQKVRGRVWIKNDGKQPCVYFNIIKAAEENPGGLIDAPISWSNSDGIELKVRDELDLSKLPTLNNEKELAITYSSDNDKVATIDPQTGVITYMKPTEPGTATISATYAGDTEYKKTTVSYTITVITNVVEAAALADYTAPESLVVEGLWTAPEIVIGKNDKGEDEIVPTPIAAGEKLIDDDYLTVATVFASKTGSVASNYLGYTFPNSIQIRVKAEPSANDVTGTEEADKTPLVVTPKTNLKLVIFGRRQTVKVGDETTDNVEKNEITHTVLWGMSVNDGKGIKAVDQTSPQTNLNQELVFGRADEGNTSYLSCAVVWELEAGNTYTIWAKGTTYQVQGIGYILPEPEAPVAPQIFIGETEHTDEEIDLSNGEVVVKFGVADDSHNVYYNFTVAGNTTEPEAPEAAPAVEPAPTIVHEGEEYTLAPAEGITLSENGTLKVLAHNPATGAKSDVVTRAVKGGTTAITEIEAAGSAEAVYYNLQGVKVENPAQGLYIRVQGGKAEKVVVK